jgi:hypothetical protein
MPSLTRAQAYVVAVAAWRATEDERLDEVGKPPTPTLRDPDDPLKILALIEDDGVVFIVGNWHTSSEARALAEFLREWYA